VRIGAEKKRTDEKRLTFFERGKTERKESANVYKRGEEGQSDESVDWESVKEMRVIKKGSRPLQPERARFWWGNRRGKGKRGLRAGKKNATKNTQSKTRKTKEKTSLKEKKNPWKNFILPKKGELVQKHLQ